MFNSRQPGSRISFESDLEMTQTDDLAARMIIDSTAQAGMVQPTNHIERIKWTAMDPKTGECDDLLIKLADGTEISAPRAFVSGVPTGPTEAALAENVRQGSRGATPAADAAQSLLSGIDGPKLDPSGDPIQED